MDDERVAELINKTLHTKPANGATHWSTRGLASETGISKSTVARYLNAFHFMVFQTKAHLSAKTRALVEFLHDSFTAHREGIDADDSSW